MSNPSSSIYMCAYVSLSPKEKNLCSSCKEEHGLCRKPKNKTSFVCSLAKIKIHKRTMGHIFLHDKNSRHFFSWTTCLNWSFSIFRNIFKIIARFTRNPFYCQKILQDVWWYRMESPFCERACGINNKRCISTDVRKENWILVNASTCINIHKNDNLWSKYYRKMPWKLGILSGLNLTVKSLAEFCCKNNKRLYSEVGVLLNIRLGNSLKVHYPKGKL